MHKTQRHLQEAPGSGHSVSDTRRSAAAELRCSNERLRRFRGSHDELQREKAIHAVASQRHNNITRRQRYGKTTYGVSCQPQVPRAGIAHRVHLQLSVRLPDWAERSECVACHYKYSLANCEWCTAPLCRHCREITSSVRFHQDGRPLGGAHCACKNSDACTQRCQQIER